MSEPLVRIENLSKSFEGDRRALDDLSARVLPGRVTGLVGPDGAGKTTLIRLVAGLLLPSSGRITVCGLDTTTRADAIHARIGYMPQRFGLYEDLTVIENLRLYADLQGVVGRRRKETFERLLDFTALDEFQSRLAGALSGGMKQKLGLACALLRKPTLLLLDEPSVGVDPVSRRELWRMARDLVDDEIGVVWSTAYLDEAEKCDEVLLLSGGRMLFDGPPSELTDRVRGRSFQVQDIESGRRRVLRVALRLEGVLDGVVQGSNVRLVLREEASPPEPTDIEAGESARVVEVEPRFEDAFIDALGGGPGGDSALAASLDEHSGGREEVVAVEGLTKEFGDFVAARDIEFSIHRREIFGLLGPNGAGKSTTFKMMCGLLRPTRGRARVAGFDLLVAPSKARARLGYMAQKFSLYGTQSVLQNLRFFSGVYGLRRRRRAEAIDRMIDIFELESFLNDSAETLPLGYKQRLALACAVMHNPDVLFLDEPTSGVDPITRREFWTHIGGMVDKGITVMVTTHFMDEAEYCDRIGLVYRGRIIALGSPDELKEMATDDESPNPTLEDAFIALIQKSERGEAA